MVDEFKIPRRYRLFNGIINALSFVNAPDISNEKRDSFAIIG